jgi:hypothetical protein
MKWYLLKNYEKLNFQSEILDFDFKLGLNRWVYEI